MHVLQLCVVNCIQKCIISRKYDIPIFANVKTWCAMKDKLGDIKDSNMKVFENDKRRKDILCSWIGSMNSFKIQ